MPLDLGALTNFGASTNQLHHHSFTFKTTQDTEPIRDIGRQIVAIVLRRQMAIVGAIEITVESVGTSLFKIRVVVSNETPFDKAITASRDDASRARLFQHIQFLVFATVHLFRYWTRPTNSARR